MLLLASFRKIIASYGLKQVMGQVIDWFAIEPLKKALRRVEDETLRNNLLQRIKGYEASKRLPWDGIAESIARVALRNFGKNLDVGDVLTGVAGELWIKMEQREAPFSKWTPLPESLAAGKRSIDSDTFDAFMKTRPMGLLYSMMKEVATKLAGKEKQFGLQVSPSGEEKEVDFKDNRFTEEEEVIIKDALEYIERELPKFLTRKDSGSWSAIKMSDIYEEWKNGIYKHETENSIRKRVVKMFEKEGMTSSAAYMALDNFVKAVGEFFEMHKRMLGVDAKSFFRFVKRVASGGRGKVAGIVAEISDWVLGGALKDKEYKKPKEMVSFLRQMRKKK